MTVKKGVNDSELGDIVDFAFSSHAFEGSLFSRFKPPDAWKVTFNVVSDELSKCW